MNPRFVPDRLSEDAFSAAIDKATEGLGIVPLDKDLPREKSISQLRRGGRMGEVDSVGTLTLVEEDGLLHWEESLGILPHKLTGRRAFWSNKKVHKQVKCEKLGFSEVAGYLEDLDRKLTPYWGLRRWNGTTLQPYQKPSGERPILLFIHGTFSKNDAIFEQLVMTKHGKAFMERMKQKYEILSFDHPTLSVSPMMNALDLARILGNHSQPIDVICHSRGGLVTRWWLETFEPGGRGQRRAVLVGAPLQGTSLVAPDKLRHGIDLLTHLGQLVGEGLSLIPYLDVATGLLRIVFSLGSMLANTPAVDAAVAAVPGLAAMSRVKNNFELARLNELVPGVTTPEYSIVASNFMPTSPVWRFWHHFADFKNRIAHLALDKLIFKAESDLVVDTESMFHLAGEVIREDQNDRVCRFHNSETVHHTNYFLQKETLEFIERRFSQAEPRPAMPPAIPGI